MDGPHAKTAVADGRLALVGSSNLEPFGLLGNYELDVELEDPAFAGALEEQFQRDLAVSEPVTLQTWTRRPRLQRLSERLSTGLLWLPGRIYSG